MMACQMYGLRTNLNESHQNDALMTHSGEAYAYIAGPLKSHIDALVL